MSKGKVFTCCGDVCKDVGNSCAKCPINKALEKLADYEDLEEQGLLLKLPLDRDKKAYMVTYTFEDGKKEYYIQTVYPIYMTICTYQGMLGKTIFSTREEAEKKLNEVIK